MDNKEVVSDLRAVAIAALSIAGCASQFSVLNNQRTAALIGNMAPF